MGRRGGQAGARGGGGDGADRGGRAPPRSHSAGKVVKRGERGGGGRRRHVDASHLIQFYHSIYVIKTAIRGSDY